MGRDSLDFSFSGLKTAVLYHVRGVPRRGQDVKAAAPELGERQVAEVAASFQAAAVDVILQKLRRANSGLRAALSRLPVPVFVPPLRYCTDNAAMSAGLAEVYFREGRTSALDLDAITHSQFLVS